MREYAQSYIYMATARASDCKNGTIVSRPKMPHDEDNLRLGKCSALDMQALNTAAAAVQSAHLRLQAHPPPAVLVQRIGDVPPLQGVRMPEGSQQNHNHALQHNHQQQAQAKAPGEHAASVPHQASSSENDSQTHASPSIAPAYTSDPILIPLMCRVASIIEYLKTHLSPSDASASAPTAVAVTRLEHALVSVPSQ
jgi:hypothetical protein